MAIDKAHSPAWVKITVWVLVVSLIVGFVAIGFASAIPQLGKLFGGGGTTTSTGGATVNADTLDTINAGFQSQAVATEASVTADPENLNLRKSAAGIYMDWAFTLLGSSDAAAQAAVATTIAKAIPHWEKALELAPEDEQVAGDLATSYFYSGDSEKAIETARAAIELNPDYATVWYNLGIYLQTTGDIEGAKEALTNAISKATSADASVKTAAQAALDSLAQ